MSATPTEVDEAPVAQPWHVERDDRVSTIVYRGGRRRTLGISGAAQLAGLLTERSARAEPPVVVLDIGILHAELTEVLEMGAGRPIGDWAPWLAAIDGLDQYPSATIVTIGDQASCGGLELALAADIRIVSPDARLGVLESRMGLIPGAGGTQRLSTLLGRGWASLLCFSGETISGAEAHRIGLAQLIEPDPLRAGGDLAERLSQRGHEVLVAAKRALTAGPQPSKEGLRTEGRAFLSVVGLPSTTASMRDWLRRQAADDPPARDRSMLP